MDERIYQANIKLVDENNMLKKDNVLLERRIRKAITLIESSCINYYADEPHYRGIELINVEDLLDTLKGEEQEKDDKELELP